MSIHRATCPRLHIQALLRGKEPPGSEREGRFHLAAEEDVDSIDYFYL